MALNSSRIRAPASKAGVFRILPRFVANFRDDRTMLFIDTSISTKFGCSRAAIFLFILVSKELVEGV